MKRITNIFNKSSRKRITRQFSTLVSIAYADSVLMPEELAHLKYKAEKLGIKAEDFQVILESSKDLDIYLPKTDEEKIKQLNDLVEVAMVDGNFCNQEWEFFIKIGKLLGYTLGEMENIVRNSFNLTIPRAFYDSNETLE